jgi:bla regulator protein BlaR1
MNYLLTNERMQVLFWTLIHSLWQGIIFAFITGIILISTKRSTTALRYKLLSSVLVLFIITSICTFFYEVFSITNHEAVSYKTVAAFAHTTVTVNNHAANVIESVLSFLKPYENLIVLIWFAIIIIKCLGLVKGLREVYMLKHCQVFNAGEYWSDRLQVLAKKTGIKKQILLLKSTLAKVPMAIGYFKPVILFPAAALTALAPEEIEAILLHELAHISRKDYLINIFQRIAEIIFFFNPAVLWISSLIKEERENCCDDIAVNQTKNKKQFIHALVSFQEYNTLDYEA